MEEKLERLQVRLAHSGVASRRACEKLILDGRVCVNGNVVSTLGAKVSQNDEVTLDGKIVCTEEKKRYILLNKPVGLVCTRSDEKGRETVFDLLKPSFDERLYSVGRLDMFSSGALLFTNDGDFAAMLSHPSAQIEKEYIVESVEPLPRFLSRDFVHGIRIDGIFYRAISATDINSHEMKVVLVEGKNREIRRVFENAGAKIRSLKRVRIGCVFLENLSVGSFRELSAGEVDALISLCKNKK